MKIEKLNLTHPLHLILVLFTFQHSLQANAKRSLTDPDASIQLTSPMPRQINQRTQTSDGVFAVSGTLTYQNVDGYIVVTVMDHKSHKSVLTQRTDLPAANPEALDRPFNLDVKVSAGWYDLKTTFFTRSDDAKITESSVSQVGIGEVFLVAGQSNAANHGSVQLTPKDERVSAFNSDTGTWQFAADPQPVASRWGWGGGSPWPEFGDQLVKALKVPVGIINVAWGGSSVHEWERGVVMDGSSHAIGLQPTPLLRELYPRLQKVVQALPKNGIRALLWHQGETDALIGTPEKQYRDSILNIMNQVNQDAGYKLPWVIAQATAIWFPDALIPESTRQSVRNAQSFLWSPNGPAFKGPDTDTLALVDAEHGASIAACDKTYRAPDCTHMNGEGLMKHGGLWATSVLTAFFDPNSKPPETPIVTPPSNEISVSVDGKPLKLSTAPYMSKQGSVMVPMRAIFEALGAGVKWEGTTQTITATQKLSDGTDDVVVSLTLDKNSALVDGQAVTLSQAAVLSGGSTFVPLRFVAESLGASVEWNKTTFHVSITR